MRLVESLYFDRRILDVVTVNIQLELVADTLRVDNGRYTFLSFIKQRKYGVIHIVVNQHNGFFCFPYQIGHETISVKHLPVIEYALHRRNTCIQTFENFVNTFVLSLPDAVSSPVGDIQLFQAVGKVVRWWQ